MDVALRFINASDDGGTSNLVVFPMQASTFFQKVSIAWTVIRDCPEGGERVIACPEQSTAFFQRQDATIAAELPASPGDRFCVVTTQAGQEMRREDRDTEPGTITITNLTDQQRMTVGIRKDGRLYSGMGDLYPNDTVAFLPMADLWFAVMPGVEQGQIIGWKDMSDNRFEVTLDGIVSADIVMTDGGTWPDGSPRPFNFAMKNVIRV